MISAPVIAQQSAPPIRDNSVTSASIKDGEVKTADLANNAVTSPKIADGTIQEQDIADGVIPSGGIQPTVHIVGGPETTLTFGNIGDSEADCPSGEILTGGGSSVTDDVHLLASFPPDENTWRAVGRTQATTEDEIVKAFAVCLDFSP